MKAQALIGSLKKRSTRQLTRVAAMLALAGLAVMCISVVFPRPLPVILAMSIGHGIGALAVLCYALAIGLDVSRSQAAPDSLAPPANRAKPTDDPPTDS